MTCGRIETVDLGWTCGGQFDRITCCVVTPVGGINYGPFASGYDAFGFAVGAWWTGYLVLAEDGGGGPGHHGGVDHGDVFDDDDPPGCLVYGTPILLANGTSLPIESIEVGAEILSLDVPGMERDGEPGCQYLWISDRDAKIKTVTAKVGGVRHSWHDGFYRINSNINATFEHPFLVERDGKLGFLSADRVKIGDRLVRPNLSRETVRSISKIDGIVRTASLYVPGVNTYSAAGVWTHNDAIVHGPPFSDGGGTGIDPDGKSSGGVF